MGGKAKQGSDYTLSGNPGQATIPPGSSSVTVTLNAIADHVTEKKESAIMTLLKGSSYTLSGAKKATVSIISVP